MVSPSPRDGLDEGSIAELAQNSREIEMDVTHLRPRDQGVPSVIGPIDVPADAPALVDGLATYGAC